MSDMFDDEEAVPGFIIQLGYWSNGTDGTGGPLMKESHTSSAVPNEMHSLLTVSLICCGDSIAQMLQKKEI
jgi:hypothetical protein